MTETRLMTTVSTPWNHREEEILGESLGKTAVAKATHTGRRLRFFGLGSLLVIAFVVGFVTAGPHQVLDALGAQANAVLGIHRPITVLEDSGVVLLNETDLKNHILLPMHGIHRRYWIGPITGSRYTTNCVTPGLLIVSYIRANSTLANATLTNGVQPFVTVTAYESQAIYNSHLRPLSDDPQKIVTNSRGDVISYDPTSLTRLVIMPKGSDEVITINYSTPQSVASAIANSQKLVQL